MTIATRDDYYAALAGAQTIRLYKSASRTSVAAIPFSVFDLAGDPGAGVLAGTSTAAGVVPTDATAGCPTINAFAGGATGYLMDVEFGCSVAGRVAIYDMVFKAGAYACNANQALSGQPSYAGRVPGGNYSGCEIWIEAVTAFTGTPSFSINYTDQGGAAGATGVVSAGAALTQGRMFKMPFAAGDDGAQSITNVAATVATVGTFNVLVMRRLWQGRVRIANDGDRHDGAKVGLPIVFADSALVMVVTADSTSTGLPDCEIRIGNK